MIEKPPKISVVLPVFNGAKFIKSAVQSILDQTFVEFELIIIDDGSNDKTLKIIRSFTDKRIRIISRENRGLVSTLNEAIEKAVTPIIARHDADDISDPDRFSKQLKLINSGNILVGSSIKTMDHQGKIINTHYVLTGNNTLKQELFTRSPFAHGSVMFSKQAFLDAGRYIETEWPAEDYGLWLRMAEFGSFQNVHEPLYHYRENLDGISTANSKLQQERADQTRKQTLSNHKLIGFLKTLEPQADKSLRQRQYENFKRASKIAISVRNPIMLLKLLSSVFFSPSIQRLIIYNTYHKLWQKQK